MTPMPINEHISFTKCYLNLGRLFDPAEMIFILHMQRVEYLRQTGRGHWSKKFLMKAMNLGVKVFDRCARRLEEMELLIVSSGRHPNYRWNTKLYHRLIEILNVTDNLDALDEFCRRVFLEGKRSIGSVSAPEIEELGKSDFFLQKGGSEHSQK